MTTSNAENNSTMKSISFVDGEAATPVFRSTHVGTSHREPTPVTSVTLEDHLSGFSPPTIDHFKASPSKIKDSCDSSLTVSKQTEQKGGVGRGNQWSRPVVTQLPLFHSLSKNHHVRVNRDDLSIVLSNLQECFRLLSLHCRFRDNPVSATCRSMDAVELRVHVWEDKSNDNDNGLVDHSLIVEVQRISGDSIQSNQYIRKILAAAKQTSETAIVGISSKVRPILSPATIKRGVHAVEGLMSDEFPDDNSDVVFAESVEIVRSLLVTDRYDARLLGSESLAIMTDTNKTSETTARWTAQAVLATDALVRDTIISLAFRGSWPRDQQYHKTGGGNHDDYRLIKQHSYLALMIVVQSISVLHWQTTGECSAAAAGGVVTGFVRLVDSRLGCEVGMVRRLVDMVVMAQKEPHTARLASLLLAMLCESNSNTTTAAGCISDVVRETVPVDVVAQAQQIGMYSHAALETASTKLLIALQG